MNSLENLLQDFHLLLLQLCHHVHPVGETLGKGSCGDAHHVLQRSWSACACDHMQPTVPLLDDSEGLELQLHVLLNHQRTEHLEIICGQNWLEHGLNM